jgi:hypothetical protein
MPPAHDHDSASSPSVWVRRTMTLTLAGVGAALLVAVTTAAITLVGAIGGPQPAQATAQASLAAQRAAANQRWASAACTNILDWKNEIHRDGSSLSLGLDPMTRVRDAIAATTRMLNRFDALGLPPSAQTPAGRAAAAQFDADVEPRLRALEGTAASVTAGNLAAIGTLVSELGADSAVPAEAVSGLRRLLSVDLGLSLVETRACRQLVGIPV